MSRSGLAFCFAGLLLAAGGCKRARPAVDTFGEGVAAADREWARRAEAGGLDAAERAYTALLAERPTAGAVLWRLSRVAWSRVMMEPARAAFWHEVGRELALRCVAATPEVAEGILVVGDRLTPPVVVTGAPAPCRAYAAAHIVGLVRARGPGATLDLEEVGPLLAELPSEVEPAVRGWAAGQYHVLRDEEPSAAREALTIAAAASPGVGFYRAEAVRAFPDLDATLPGTVNDARWALENAALHR